MIERATKARSQRQVQNDHRMSVLMIFMVRVAFRTVPVSRIPVKYAGYLHQRSIVESGVLHHVAREEDNAAAIDPVSHPNHPNCFFLLSLHQQLHHTEADHNVLLQHLIPAHLVLLAQAALAAHLQSHDLHKDAGQMDRLSPHHRLSCRPHLMIVKKNGSGNIIWHGHGRSDLLCRRARRGKRAVVGHTLARSLGLVDKSDGGDSFLQACGPLPWWVWA